MLPRPNGQNPLGFFEDVQFRRLNDAILRVSGYRVDSWNPDVPPILSRQVHRLRIRRLLSVRARSSDCWGWKDPRQMLTNALWAEELERSGMMTDANALLVWRHPFAVARSLQDRGSVSERSTGIELWERYNERALRSLDGFTGRVLVLRYEHLMAHPEAVFARVEEFLDRALVWDDFVRRDLVRSGTYEVDQLDLGAESVAHELLERTAQ